MNEETPRAGDIWFEKVSLDPKWTSK